MFINHKRCPNCGARLKHYYWYCGSCKNQDLTNWTLTLMLWGVFLIIVVIVGTFIVGNLCSSEMLIPLINSFGRSC